MPRTLRTGYLAFAAALLSSLLAFGGRAQDSEEVLLQKLRSPDAATRRSAAEALAQMPHENMAKILPDLLPALKDPDADVRFYVAVTLHTADYVSNEANAKALRQAVPTLAEALKDKDARVREMAASALCLLVPPPVEVVSPVLKLLNDPERKVRYAALDVLASVGPSALDALPAVLKVFKEDSAPDVRGRAANVFGELRTSDPRVIQALIEALRDSDSFARGMSINALGKIGPPASAAIPELEKIVADKNEHKDVRSQAEYALRSIKKQS